jgi:NAD+ diphosphatase
MLHEIAPHAYHVEYHAETPKPEDYVFAFGENKALFAQGAEGLTLPRYSDFANAAPEAIYLFSIDDEKYFLINGVADAPGGLTWEPTFRFMGGLNPSQSFAGITAQQLYLWYRGHKFCGRCGTPTVHDDKERAVKCPECGELVYPKISPVVIVAVTNGDQLLLTKYANREFTRYALVAGFVEIGEASEDAVRREVFEETGVHVKNIRYYKSQPWGLPSSLLAGYYCDLDGDPTIAVDGVELSEAVWLDRADIPPQDVGFALTAEMIEAFRINSPAVPK